MNVPIFKQAIRDACLRVPKRRECQRMLDEGYETQNPYWGQCAQASEAGYVLGQVLYGDEFLQRFRAFKNYVTGPASHYWLANPQAGQELDCCDLTDHEMDPPFDYADRKLAGWINAKRTRADIKTANVGLIFDLALASLQANPNR